ncbi:hypothetical protein NDA12_005600 [Ustilago hordei]|nr:hypothetical protein NDA15_005431 [Ustilago hordei]KAJ1578724.1 hypothetical protein NDA12_005600 [Ustilago hordei]
MSFDVFSEGGNNTRQSHTQMKRILEELADNFSAELKHIRQEEVHSCEPHHQHVSPVIQESKAAGEASSSQVNNTWKWTPGSTEFEAEWARLPSAITSLPSLVKIKELVLRNSTGKASFQRSLIVLPNGIDRCFLTRPTFRHVLKDLYTIGDDQLSDSFEHREMFQPNADIISFTETLWETHFSVPRNLFWYAARAPRSEIVAKCTQVQMGMRTAGQLGLSILAEEFPVNVVHCALAGTRRSLTFVGPSSGLLYMVVQGSLLLISWPYSERNFDTWHRLSCNDDDSQSAYLDVLEQPYINMLRDGDAAYLGAGTTHLMLALSHVSLISREILNPAPDELNTVMTCCNRLLDRFIEQQKDDHSPCDDLGVTRMQNNKKCWDKLATHVRGRKALIEGTPADEPPNYSPFEEIDEFGPLLKAFKGGMKKLGKKIHQYCTLVDATSSPTAKCDTEGSYVVHDRARDTLFHLIKLTLLEEDGGGTSGNSACIPLAEESHPRRVRKTTQKGKQRVPS